MGIPDHLTCFLKNMNAGQEATVRTRHGTVDWFQIGKGVHQGCISSPCLFNVYVEYIMGNAMLDEAQAEIKIAGENINILYWYFWNITICRWYHPYGWKQRGNKSLLMKVNEKREKACLKLKIQEMKIMAFGPITSWQIDLKTMEKWQTLFWGAQKSLQMVTKAMNLKDAYSLKEKLWPT